MKKRHHWTLDEIAMALIFFVIPFDRAVKIVTIGDTVYITATKILILVALSAWLIRCLLNREVGLVTLFFEKLTNLMMVAFLLVSFISIIQARSYGEFTKEMIQRVSLITFALLIIGVIKSRRVLTVAVAALIVGSVFASLAGVYELITQKAILEVEVSGRTELMRTPEGGFRIQGFSGDADNHVSNMVMFFGLALGLFFYAKKKKIKAALFIVLMLLLVNIVGSASRGGMLAFLSCIAVFFVYFRSRWKPLIAGAAFLGAIAVYCLMSLMSSVATIERFSEKSLGGPSIKFRMQQAQIALVMASDNPILGLGTGGYLEEIHRYRRRANATRYVPGVPVELHIPYLGILAENGIIGFAVFTTMILSVVRNLHSTSRGSTDDFFHLMGAGNLASFIGFLVILLFLPSFPNEIGWMLMALSVILSTVRFQNNPSEGIYPAIL
jgi:O-antigen ligase